MTSKLVAVGAVGVATILVGAAPASAQTLPKKTEWAFTTDSGGAGGEARIRVYPYYIHPSTTTRRNIYLDVLDRDNNDHKVAYARAYAETKGGRKLIISVWDGANNYGGNWDIKVNYPRDMTIRAIVCLVNKYGQTTNTRWCSWTKAITT
ncbi:MAG: hypothetical protein JWN52_1793 [Actinomycetia bacterium]|nr:hypothetical protein [Actinomycetes bacterium]